MRRGTQAATEFGLYVRQIRTTSGLSARLVAQRLGMQPAFVSQVEYGQRALKEHRVAGFAKALGIPENVFRAKWLEIQEEYPEPLLRRPRTKAPSKHTLEIVIKDLTGLERAQVLGYIDRLLEARDTP